MRSSISGSTSRRGYTLKKLLLASLCMAVLIIFGYFGARATAVAQSSPNADRFQPLATIPAKAQQVETGIFAMNLYNLDMSSNTYYFDFYAWFRWKGEIDPTANLELANGVEDWGVTKVPVYEKPEKLPDGSLYQALRIEGRFVQPFDLSRYPLDQQKLHVALENSLYTTEQLVYVTDTEQSGYSTRLSIPGWQLKNQELSSLVHEYATNFGDSRVGNANTSYSVLQYSLLITRPVSFFIWKLLLPLLIVLAASWGSLLLNPKYVDSRIMLPVTALLTTVFLQQSYSTGLPDVGHLVLLDKIYAIAYVLIVSAILEAIVTADWMKSDEENAHARIIRLDRLTLGVQAGILTVGIMLIVMFG